MIMLPTFEDIQRLHRKYAPNEEAYDLIFTHCLIVCDIADDLMRQNPELQIDTELVRTGALLHDIGAYSLFRNGDFHRDYITHGIKGSEILQSERMDVRLVRIASHHTGVGLSKNDIVAQTLPLPAEDFLAETIEEKIIMYADKFHSKTPKFNTYESYAKTVARFGNGKERTFQEFKEQFGLPDLLPLAKKYGDPII